MTKRHWLFVGIIAALLLLVGGVEFYLNYTPADPVAAPVVPEIITAQEPHTMGNPKAKVTMIEYAALICPWCAQFNMEVLPALKKNYIDTGKVFYVYRLYMLDPADAKAEKLARCLPREQYFDATDLLYRRQEEWGPEQNGERGAPAQPKTDAGLAKMAAALHVDPDKAQACMSSTALDGALNQTVQNGQKRYGINSTPTFVINGVVQAAPENPQALAAILDPLLESNK